MPTPLENLIYLRDLVANRPDQLFGLENVRRTEPCGAICCVVGTAAESEYFNEQGLSLYEGQDSITYVLLDGEILDYASEQLKPMFGPNLYGLFAWYGNGPERDVLPTSSRYVLKSGSQYGTTEVISPTGKRMTDKELALWRLDREIERMQNEQG